ncbi:hypothetical protein [Catellatospora bangladeshensis]|uniref:Uncharacterized protein n=1 Tax=Catellatospora bangladeshensis TaxID=310355 RepID=A0A8J3NHS1_9ACTN|nr:hypothetical protein [Catellatospora bangladeshensis]GIF81685.1 hypothetical protein Cba03nite_30340 [Catellatospora bangladeshensis]
MLVDFGGERLAVTPAVALDGDHGATIRAAVYDGRLLRFPDPEWRCVYLGAGEEKACFGVRDGAGRMFVLEVLDERTYLNGRFVGGTYFGDHRVPGLAGVPKSPGAAIGLRFTGLVKARQWVYGHEWARFRWRPDRPSPLDAPLTAYLRLVLGGRYARYHRHYRDVHERNVLFEVRPARARGVPVVTRDLHGRIGLRRVGLQPIDLR